ncbi:MAG TPA: type IX secretion system outer membrane channel protein PorV [Tenuifilaceae bacterium]|nr:type IX secretion system outer membrane channel protein PorV [Tenuifilaceae bacterium]
MQKSIKISVLVFMLLLALKPVSSQTIDIGELTGGLNALRVGVPFLIIAPDSRAGAMGDAGVASTPDIHSQHWNPAKYAFIDKQFGLSLSYTPWLRNLIDDINLSYLAGYYRLDDQQVISGSLLYFSMGDIIFTNDQGQTMTTHNPNEFALDAAYSRKFADKIGGAIAFRYIRSDLTGGYSQLGQSSAKAGSSAAADVSMYYETPISLDNKDHEFALGLNISNIGNKVSYNDDITKDFIPINMRLGGRFTYNMDIYNAIGIMVDANKLLVPTPPLYDTENEDIIIAGMDPDVSVPAGMMQSFYDAPGGFKEEIHEFSFSVGLEYWYAGQFAIRAGYFDEHQTKGNRKYFTIGAGLKYNVFNLDFAYLVPRAGQANPLANTVRFTLGFEFEPSRRGGGSQRNN